MKSRSIIEKVFPLMCCLCSPAVIKLEQYTKLDGEMRVSEKCSENHGSSGCRKVAEESFGTFDKETLISEIDRMIGEHCQNVFHAVERVSARLTQIESRSRHLESLVEDVKDSVEYNQQRTDGKLRQLENVLGEVELGVQFLRDKQDIAEAQMKLQLAKLQLSRKDKDLKGPTDAEAASSMQSAQPATAYSGLPQALSSTAYCGSPQALSSTAYCGSPQALSSTAYSGSPQALSSTAYSGSPQAHSSSSPLQPAQLAQAAVWQLPQNYMPSVTSPLYNPPPTPMPYSKNEHYLMSPPQMLQPTPPIPLDPVSPHYPRTSSAPQYSPQTPTSTSSQGFPHVFSQQAAEAHYNPSSRFPKYTSQTPRQAIKRADYDHHPYPNTGSENRYGGSNSDLPYSTAKFSSPLQSAQVLPYALPTASPVAGGSNSSGSGNKIPVDDVVDKVAAMGFRRDMVKLTVKKLIDSGQVVDLNSVLDQMMNN